MTSVDQEVARLNALVELGLLDTEPDSEFDELVELAAAICGVPISLMSLLDDHRQWFKAAVGLDIKETSREVAFCAYTIQQDDLFIVPDAMLDSRFATNPLVADGPRMRFYAGMPLMTPSGFAVGALCVIDREPRTLTPHQTKALRVLAHQLTARIERHLLRRDLSLARTEKDKIAAGLVASEELFRTFMNNSPMASYIKNPHGSFVFRNDRYLETFGNAVDISPSPTDLLPWPAGSEPKDEERTHGDAVLERTEDVLDADGHVTHWRSFSFPCLDAEGRTLLGCVATDITSEVERHREFVQAHSELEEANEHLSALAVTDKLTGLRNRRALEERLIVEFSMHRRKGRELTVVLLDIDNFKKINDELGHPAGDDVLRQFGRVLESTVRITDLAVRYGGEEFAILMPESNEASAVILCERLQGVIAATAWTHRKITVSLGAATLGPDCADCTDLISYADQALYAAKRAGKDRLVLASSVSIKA